ncbi:hypothetical protein SanaruYs_16010 [Chryseotalea sanaruensis]|uniref:Uncharacterized protein n=1 Tax=Chryseotalea sanaruensis TaxID=2482724 RepID=A0A401U911_9BACT|nr:redoxin domain-containing protein [Chryseotalea sanaruensis]GCC51376.1 hypothetical protein SanaruYs_16010 [Chryseotalea sanaruensis]
MRKLILILVISVIAILSLLISLKQNKVKQLKTIIPEFTLTTLIGDTIIFNKSNFPTKLILNFYSYDCTLCMAEISDIISFSRENSIPILFISADSLGTIISFTEELKSQGISDEDKISFARVSLQDVYGVFGSLAVPQSVLFEEGLKIKMVKKGILSRNDLLKSFE